MFSFGKQQPSPTLLLIDDDLVSREVMATVLTMSGYAVHTAEGGAPALKLLEDG
jgi:CheY-like chemotaxis protein